MTHLNLLSVRNASLLLVSALFAGCSPMGPGPKIVSPPSRPVRMVTPIDFFSPEQKRLGQHLGWQTGCFKVDYSGPETSLHERLEVWTDGKPGGNNGSSTMSAGNSELSISVKESGTPLSLLVTQGLSSEKSSSISTSTYTRPKFDGWSTRIAKIQGPVELLPGRETAVWALILRKTSPKGDFNTSASTLIAEQAANSDWALVLNVKLGPEN